MEQLKFSTAVFERGLNVTVRLGDKWHKFLEENSEDGKPVEVELATSEGNVIGKGAIEATEELPFHHIAFLDTVLSLEHDTNCRNMSDLYNALKRVYGDSFTANSNMTLVFFTVSQVNDESMWNEDSPF